MEKIKELIRRLSGMDILIAIIAIAATLIAVMTFLDGKAELPDQARILGVMVGLLSIAIALIQSSFARQEENFKMALTNIREDDSTVRTLSIGMLKVYLTNERMGVSYPIFGNVLMTRRPSIVAEGLANHLAKESDEFVGEVCIRALIEADANLRTHILTALCKNNRSLWKQRNRESAKVYRDKFEEEFLNRIQDGEKEDNEEFMYAARQQAHKIAQPQAEQRAYRFEIPLSLIRKAIVEFLKINGQGRSRIGAEVAGDIFNGVHLDYADFTRADLSNCDFTGATLTHVNFKQAILKNAKFNRAIILNSYFSETDIEEASFEGAILGCCHFHKLREGEKRPSTDRMKEALLVVGNKYTEEIKSTQENIPWKFEAEEDSFPDKNKSIYLTYEFDWQTIWKPKGTEDNLAVFDAKQYTPFSSDVIDMVFKYTDRKTEYGKTIIARVDAGDGHNGDYIVEDEFDIRPAHMKYIAGYRILEGDEHRWEGVYWNLSDPEKRDIRFATQEEKTE